MDWLVTDKSVETESEAEYVTASATSTQVSSEGYDQEERTPRKTHGGTTLNDYETTESERNESEVELSGQSPKVKHKCRKKKRRQRKEKLDIQSNSSGSTSSTSSTEGEEFSDDEHAFLITSVANLRRRGIMNLQRLRTKSKEAPRMKLRKKS